MFGTEIGNMEPDEPFLAWSTDVLSNDKTCRTFNHITSHPARGIAFSLSLSLLRISFALRVKPRGGLKRLTYSSKLDAFLREREKGEEL